MELKTMMPFSAMDASVDRSPDDRMHELRRYHAAVERLPRAGIKTERSVADQYQSPRSIQSAEIRGLAPQYAYDMDEIDPALAKAK